MISPPLLVLARRGLRIAAAQVARRQHGLRADVAEHRLRGEPDLREQPLRAAAGEVEHRVRILARRAAGSRMIGTMVSSSMSSSARDVRFGSPPGIGLLMKWITCAFSGGAAERRRRALRLRRDEPEALRDAVRQPLRAVAPVDHQLLRQLDRRRIGGVEEEHRRRGAGIELLLARRAQQVAHRDRHVAEVDVDRARVHALVADRAVVGDVGELVEMAQRNAAARLLLVQERLDQQRRGEDLVARAIEQVGARHVRRAHRLALAAAQAVLDRVGDAADLALLEDQALRAEQR